MKKFIEKYIDNVEKTDLDLNWPFYDENEESTKIEYSKSAREFSLSEAPSLDIDEAISVLQELKKQGANRVYIGDHCDHHGYHFTGVKLVEVE